MLFRKQSWIIFLIIKNIISIIHFGLIKTCIIPPLFYQHQRLIGCYHKKKPDDFHLLNSFSPAVMCKHYNHFEGFSVHKIAQQVNWEEKLCDEIFVLSDLELNYVQVTIHAYICECLFIMVFIENSHSFWMRRMKAFIFKVD